jgi:hypothetical protein
MDSFWKGTIRRQFGAAIDMLENAMRVCPDELWSDPSKRPQWVSRNVVGFWYVAFHTLFFLDYYLSERAETFVPPAPFTLDELDPSGLLPDRPYTKAELLGYLDHCRKKCHAAIEAMTEEEAHQHCGFKRLDFTGAELLLDNMRHVQHHAAQLNLLLRQSIDSAPPWINKEGHKPGADMPRTS